MLGFFTNRCLTNKQQCTAVTSLDFEFLQNDFIQQLLHFYTRGLKYIQFFERSHFLTRRRGTFEPTRRIVLVSLQIIRKCEGFIFQTPKEMQLSPLSVGCS